MLNKLDKLRIIMKKATLTRAYLSDIIHKELGFSKDDSLQMVGYILDSIEETVKHI